MTCTLCKETASGGYVSHIAHIESHLVEIALSVMPTDEDPDREDPELAEPALGDLVYGASTYQMGSSPVPIPNYVEYGSNDAENVMVNDLLSAMKYASGLNYKPSGLRKGRRTKPITKRRERHELNSKSANRTGKQKAEHLSRKDDEPDVRSFPCPLTSYGCQSSFVSKNEWKRHVSTQHIKLGFWRCDLCPTTVDPHDETEIYHNDFNRKDLFTQHLRRMHCAPPSAPNSADKSYPVTEENIADHLRRCFQKVRSLPTQSSCLFCERSFTGPNSWDERMEHVGRHLEKDRKLRSSTSEPKDWISDPELEKYLVEEGLIRRDQDGNWSISDGKPLRRKDGSDEDADDG